ncbi:penicillin-binding protein 2 [Hymenobacter saemangeumensis]|uniref:Penicillin-binding protein 2 n=2 Tax=Hymenobacter saemangeumensis TaxID=1084522 RepID=A0ABP8I0A9_9BACT
MLLGLAGLLLGAGCRPDSSARPEPADAPVEEVYEHCRETFNPIRGRIFDRHDSLLAYTGWQYRLELPRRGGLDSVRFNRLLGWPKGALQARVADLRHRQLPLQLELTAAEADSLRQHQREWPQLSVRTFRARSYTVNVAAPVLGYSYDVAGPFLDQAKRLVRGRFYRMRNGGLESYYNTLLTGRRGIYHPLIGPGNRRQGSWDTDTAYIAGQDLHLSLDTQLQAYAERLLGERRGYVVALEPATGEILCYVSAPTYDPAVLTAAGRGRERRELLLHPDMPLLNRPALLANPPGSVFKLVNSAVALQLGAITPETGFRCDQSLINCVHDHPRARSLSQALKYSCNPYFYQVMRTAIEPRRDSAKAESDSCGIRQRNLTQWLRHVRSFGLDTLLGIDLPQERPGYIPQVKLYDRRHGACCWSYKTIYSLSLGQGEINLTGLQMANVLAIIANRGWYVRPHLVRSVGKSGQPLPKYQERRRTLVDSMHFAALIPGMEAAMRRGGTAELANLDDVGISVAGKTGTVQNDEGDDHATFAGFAPATAPRIVVAVYIENAGFGGLSAAPLAALLMEKYLRGSIAPKRRRWERWLRCGNLVEQGQHKPKPAAAPELPPPAPPVTPAPE